MATAPRDVDPRTAAGGGGATVDQGSVLPQVAVRRPGLPNWALAGLALVAAILLFTILDARRRSLNEATPERVATSDALTPPPPALVLPPSEDAAPLAAAPEAPPPQPAAAPPAPAPAPQVVYVPTPAPPPVIFPTPDPAPVAPPTPRSTSPALVIDNSRGEAGGAAAPAASAEGAAAAAPGTTTISIARARSGVFANRSTTVPQGTLIPAVLETALDSTRPGFARAIVSRDVRGFDGSQVLIPRGSRLIGEYRSDASAGQRRALVNWIRLIRPDGVTIAIDSPAGDPLGRGGVRARVNSHFFERFAGSLLQSALTIGGTIAATSLGSGYIIGFPGAFPGALQGATQIVPQSQVTPTLTVRHGTSISIFVARDLDFTGANQRR